MTRDEYDRVITDLEAIWDELWGIDIPSPTVPEYIEHHQQIQSVMKLVRQIEDKYMELMRVEVTDETDNK